MFIFAVHIYPPLPVVYLILFIRENAAIIDHVDMLTLGLCLLLDVGPLSKDNVNDSFPKIYYKIKKNPTSAPPLTLPLSENKCICCKNIWIIL